MSKKLKKVLAFADDFKVLIKLIPKLEAFLKVYNEIAAGYQKYRKNGGAAISGVEKYIGIKEQNNTPASRPKEVAKIVKIKAHKSSTPTIKNIK